MESSIDGSASECWKQEHCFDNPTLILWGIWFLCLGFTYAARSSLLVGIISL